MVIGDMDSISADARSRFADAGCVFQLHPTDKDKTDLELALDFALELRPSSISIAGALGGMRLDHTIGNLLLLTLPALHDVEVRLVHESGEVFVARKHSPLTGTPGDYVSLLPISDRVEGVATAGLRYPLHGETLHRGSTRGVSNELTESQAWISVSAGLLLVCHERGVST
jgi:thiamine pyrophosphokinase